MKVGQFNILFVSIFTIFTMLRMITHSTSVQAEALTYYQYSHPLAFKTHIPGVGELFTIFAKERDPKIDFTQSKIVIFQKLQFSPEGEQLVEPGTKKLLSDWHRHSVSIRGCESYSISPLFQDKMSFAVLCVTYSGQNKYGRLPLLGYKSGEGNNGQLISWEQDSELRERINASLNGKDPVGFSESSLRFRTSGKDLFNYFDYDGENQFISIVANQNCSRIVIHRPYKYLLCTGGLTIFNSETKQVTKIAVSGLENAKTKNRADNYNLLADLLVYEGQNKKMSALIAFQTNLDQGLKIYSLSDLHGTPVISSPQVRKNLPQGEVKIFSNLSYKTSEQQIEFDVLVLENSQPDISFNWHIFDHYRPGNDFSLITPRVLNMDKTSLANCQTDGVFIGDLFATGCTNPQNSNYHNLYSLSEVDSTSHLRKLIAVNNGGLSEQTIVTPMMGTQNSLPAVVIINYKGQYVFFNN